MFVRLLLLVALSLSSTTAIAQFDPGSLDHLDWRLVGPFCGGRVLAVSGVPGQPQHCYFGSVNGGIWESNDAGRTWMPIFDDQPVGPIGTLAIAPSDPSVIHVGTGEADMRLDIAQGDGMYVSRSDDGGSTFIPLKGDNAGDDFHEMRIDPAGPQRQILGVDLLAEAHTDAFDLAGEVEALQVRIGKANEEAGKFASIARCSRHVGVRCAHHQPTGSPRRGESTVNSCRERCRHGKQSCWRSMRSSLVVGWW